MSNPFPTISAMLQGALQQAPQFVANQIQQSPVAGGAFDFGNSVLGALGQEPIYPQLPVQNDPGYIAARSITNAAGSVAPGLGDAEGLAQAWGMREEAPGIAAIITAATLAPGAWDKLIPDGMLPRVFNKAEGALAALADNARFVDDVHLPPPSPNSRVGDWYDVPKEHIGPGGRLTHTSGPNQIPIPEGTPVVGFDNINNPPNVPSMSDVRGFADKAADRVVWTKELDDFETGPAKGLFFKRDGERVIALNPRMSDADVKGVTIHETIHGASDGELADKVEASLGYQDMLNDTPDSDSMWEKYHEMYNLLNDLEPGMQPGSRPGDPASALGPMARGYPPEQVAEELMSEYGRGVTENTDFVRAFHGKTFEEFKRMWNENPRAASIFMINGIGPWLAGGTGVLGALSALNPFGADEPETY